MPTYKILAQRITKYEFEIEAESKEEAIEEMKRIDEAEDSEEYAFEWQAFEIKSIEED